MKITKFPKPIKNLLWASDLHLDDASDFARKRFYSKLFHENYDAVMVTGDISNAHQLADDLEELASAVSPMPLFFSLGNHDHFNSCFASVDQVVRKLCSIIPNLYHLDNSGIIELSRDTCLVGHKGWYDGQAGAGVHSKVYDKGRHAIGDFDGLSHKDYFKKLADLGHESATHFRGTLPLALKRYARVMIGTHVPPYWDGIMHGEARCSWDHQPYYANVAAGKAIGGILRRFGSRKLEIYAGHAHTRSTTSISKNLTQHIAEGRRGAPSVERLIKVA